MGIISTTWFELDYMTQLLADLSHVEGISCFCYKFFS